MHHFHHEGFHYAAWGTFITTAVAVVAAIVASRKLYQLETARDQELKRLAKFDQAIQISGWVESNPDIEKYQGAHQSPSVVAIISNPSLQPIFNIVIVWYYKGAAFTTDRAEYIKPRGGFYTFDIPRDLLRRLSADGITVNSAIFQNLIIYPDIAAEFESSEGIIDISGNYRWEITSKVAEVISAHFKILFSFTDINGVRWQRNVDGRLSESKITPN